ncbi:TRAP transporter small permease [Cocleimonas flava]|uniref:TRAP transporter small permease protein n=1 Tax=Cocleimonas flava TaxID=634765 RepID=A0A4R1EPD4_9GAMM|nr:MULTISPECIES: TRAP transporter small permease subunit [Cocleimonas]MEB8432719.1 TRAP transporter small permease subunit [Cocleimonas sp. KMM 6892]MEC4715578.1 TRAP transporter small permease subunit [Cocleimonas sp. KMM 6895]MEC4744804.1 TRAP transporter small permease subunit [Cocleimonas sp. KMM 6896]TCJ83147.1 TRAP-type C4-dicarboxylate transport system permease small subunit [Cocleimonas flava]
MIKRSLEAFCTGLRIILAVLVGSLVIPVAMQVIARYTGIIPVFLWTEELATFIFVWVVMIGSVLAVWEGTHFDVQVLPDSPNPLILLIQKSIVLLLVGGFGFLFAWYGIEYAKFGGIQHSVMMNANLMVTHITVPLAGLFWGIFSLFRFVEAFQQYKANKRAVL